MTVKERPLFGKVDVQAKEGASWVTYIADATGVNIRRGGVRDGLGIKTDVGLCSFTLKDNQDPLNGGTFKPGQAVRVMAGVPSYTIEHPERGHWGPGPDVVDVPAYDVEHPEVVVLSEGFESGLGGWETYDGERSTEQAHSGSYSISTGITSNSRYADITVPEIVPGLTYTMTAWVYTVPGEGYTNVWMGDYDTWQETTSIIPGVWALATSTFVAGSSQILELAGWHAFWDDITLTQAAWTETVPATYKPGPDVWVVDEAAWTETIPGVPAVPIFSGRITDIASVYPYDKQTNTDRAMVTVTVADAVQLHATTPRYGVSIATGFETFEERITRLAASALAPVTAPIVNAPREVYSF